MVGVVIVRVLCLFFIWVFIEKVGCLYLDNFFVFWREIELLMNCEVLVNELFMLSICIVFIVWVILVFFFDGIGFLCERKRVVEVF